jgi:hypothetical protein
MRHPFVAVTLPRRTETFAHTLNPQISRWLLLFLWVESLDTELIYAIGLLAVRGVEL